MFVTDTVDAIYPPDVWLPQAIMDRLGEILSDSHGAMSVDVFQSPNLTSPATALSVPVSSPRRPLLSARRIDTIADLQPFFSGVSLSAYESVYNSGGKVDWDAVERGLEREIFDGEANS